MPQTELIDKISDVTKSEPNLVYKSPLEIKKALENNWLILQDPGISDEPQEGRNPKLKGFIIVTPLSKNLAEVGTLYVYPEYRRKGNAKVLIQKAFKACGNRHILIRTKEKKLKIILEKKGFSRVSLKKNWQLGLIYLWSRLSHPKKWLHLLKTFRSKSTAMVFEPGKVSLF